VSPFVVEEWGTTGYAEAWERQRQYVQEILDESRSPTLIFTEHRPVITLGANFKPDHLKQPREWFHENGVDVITTDRGGDVTYHGPGQLVVYPLFPLDWVDRDLHRWLRELERTTMAVVGEFGPAPRQFPPHTGVWIEGRKVAAIGIKVRRWVSLHGIALNCDLDLRRFESIVPCGIHDFGVTSLTEAVGRTVTTTEAMPIFREAFLSRFS
jgi:lipoyl(octanoyl) transferase